MDIKLPFALVNSSLVHIDDEKVLKGLNNGNYKCPNKDCGATLIARKGDERVNHFSHYTATCNYGLESALHLFGKMIIEKEKRIRIPSLLIGIRGISTFYEHFYYYEQWFKKKFQHDNFEYILNKYPINKFYETYLTEYLILEDKFVNIDKVTLEKKFNDFTPDLIIDYEGKKCLIEIKVKHGINKEKLEKIKNSKTSALEIDLSKFYKENKTFEPTKLRKIILEEVLSKYWIYSLEKDLWLLENKERLLSKLFQLFESHFRTVNKEFFFLGKTDFDYPSLEIN